MTKEQSKKENSHPLIVEEEQIQILTDKIEQSLTRPKEKQMFQLQKLHHQHQMNAIKATIGILHESLKPQNNEKEENTQSTTKKK